MTARIWIYLLAAPALALAACSSSAHTTSGPTTGSGTATTTTSKPSPVPSGRIVFRRYSDDAESTGALFTSASDGSNEQQLTHPGPATLDDEPDWAPDGSHLVFTSITGTGGGHESQRLFTISNRGTALTALSPDNPVTANVIAGWDSAPAYSPDGTLIAFNHAHGNVSAGGSHGIPKGSDQIQYSDIWIMNADGSHRRQVTRSVGYTGDSGGVAWSPDGTRLVYARSNSAAGTPANGRALFIVDTNGHDQRRLTPWNLGAGGTPGWSVATDLIVFRAVQDEESGIGNFFSIHPDGTGLTQVTHLGNTTISHKIGFSPDGRWLVFAIYTPGTNSNNVFTAKADGSQQRPVTKSTAGDSSADWGRSPG